MNMRNNTYILYVKALLAALLLSPILLACSEDEGGGEQVTGDGYATLVVSIQAERTSEPVGTRAAGDPTETEEEENIYERQIEHWWVLIYNDEGFVDYLSDTKGSTATTPSGDDSQFSTSIELPIGTYRLYGFANLGSLNETDLITNLQNGTIEEGDLVANRSTLAGQAVDLGDVLDRFNVAADSRPTIPMSAYVGSVTLSEDEQNSVELGLYRMIGKVQVSITNQTGSAIDLDALSMQNFRTAGDIFLMPYDGLDRVGTDVTMILSMQPVFPTGGTTATYSSYPYPVDESEQISDKETKNYTFYVPETPLEGQDNNGSSPMIISWNIPQKGEGSRDTDFDFVRRNDLLKIPITVSNIESKLTYKNQDMPIGGIPEVLSQSIDGITIETPCRVVASHTGWLEIEYSFTTIADYGVDDIQIRYPGTTQNTGLSYSKATLTENIAEGNDYGLIIDPSTGEELPNSSAITLTPSGNTTDAADQTYKLGGPTGTLTVYTQDLDNNATATINLRLVAVCTNTDDSTTEVEIPYTIIVQNYSNDDGGN